MKPNLLSLISILFLLSLVDCKESEPNHNLVAAPTLKKAFQSDFHIGAALNRGQITGEDSLSMKLVRKEFNSITPENIMKWMHIHPYPDKYDFDMSDKFVELGEESDMQIVAHTLVWHSQLAPWVSEIKDSTGLSSYLEDHIKTIVGRYKGRIHGWDVLNEALNEDGSLRESIFYQILGEDYISKSFELAAEVDPQADLYYNDYNLCNPAKREGCIELVKKLQANNTKIDGIGIQAHFGLNYPSLDEIEKSILDYAALGVKVMFTEVDITVIPNPWDLTGADVDKNYEGSPFMNPYPEALPDSVQTELANRYRDIFSIFLKHKDKISRVTFWGVHDGQSWKNDWPIKGRTNYPLLFDRELNPKKAYQSVMSLKHIKA